MKDLLKKAKTATVVIDACEMGADRCVKAAHDFFEPYGIKVNVFALNFGSLMYLSSLSDAVVTKKKSLILACKEDIYLNLCFFHKKGRKIAEAKNRSTTAIFRASRVESGRKPYDLFVSKSEDSILRDVFGTMTGIIKNVKL